METRPPTLGRILVAVGFALSCFALALFLWLAFGGPIPLKPEGYRFTVPVSEATQLAIESDVRISGVSVGKVKDIELADNGVADATIEMDSAYSPIPSDTTAILRQKTLLGETYVELSPGSNEADPLPEDGTLPAAQVSGAVQLDEIFRAFDEPTRTAFQSWMQGQAAAFRGRGEAFNITLASLPEFATQATRALRLLDSQSEAVSGLFRNSGEVFSALAERQGQLRGLIQNSNEVFKTTADRNEELATIFTIFPTFLRESRATLTRLEDFSRTADPVTKALLPTAAEVKPTFSTLATFSGQLDPFFAALKTTIDRAPKGFPALQKILDDGLPPILGRLDPFLASLNSILQGVENYKHEVTAFLGNATAATQGFLEIDPETNLPVHYLRTEAPLTPEVLSTYSHRLQIMRTNPYFKPGGYADVETALKNFETRQCSNGYNATLPDKETTINDPNFNVRTGGDVAAASDYYDRIKLFAFNDQQSTAGIAAPPCKQQSPFDSIGKPSEQSQYLHVYPQP
jgi:phospholipid/cholesterol/gamma-HCH transport system substrate-binding protein